MSNSQSTPARVLVLGGSIRARVSNRGPIVELATGAADLEDYRKRAGDFIDAGGVLGNSEIIAGASIVGAAAEGAEVDYFPLIHLFPPKDEPVVELKADEEMFALTKMDTLDIDPGPFQEMADSLAQSQGVVLSTPVYFGDRSSVANKFLQIGSVRGLLHDKAMGMVSVGAKRNGGQETTNIFGLFEAVTQGALGVGNGPPTSQFGGTAKGGQMGHVLEDDWGLETALGTGRRIAQVAKILSHAAARPDEAQAEKVKVAIFVAIDTKEKMLRHYIDDLTRQAAQAMPWVEFTVQDLIDHRIYRCLGCNTCPKNKDTPGVRPHCVIKDPTDYLETLRDILHESDAAVIAGLNLLDPQRLIFRYQVVTERMRYMRRNNFEFTNMPFTGLCYHEFGATINPIHSLKTLVSYLRHNTIIHKPVEVFEHQGKLIESGLDALKQFCHTARRIKVGKRSLKFDKPIYVPHGEAAGYQHPDESRTEHGSR